MKLLAATLLLSGCAGYDTSVSLAFENADGRRVEGAVTFRPTGKQVIRAQK